MSPFLVFGSGLKASLVDASQCCWCWCCTSVGDDVDIDVDNMGVSSSHCVEPEWYHDWLINWLIALEEYYLLIVVVLPVQFYETMAVHTVRVLGMHPLISMQPPHSHQSPVTILCFVPLCSLPASRCLCLCLCLLMLIDRCAVLCFLCFSKKRDMTKFREGGQYELWIIWNFEFVRIRHLYEEECLWQF